MAEKEKFNNKAFDFQLAIAQKITEILRLNNVNVQDLKVNVSVGKKTKLNSFSPEEEQARIVGEIVIKIDSALNPEKKYVFNNVMDEDPVFMDEDFIDMSDDIVNESEIDL